MKKQLIKENGITLVSLVITIIVMLILAVVSLTSVLGNDGIISKARRSTLTTKLTSYKESFETYLLGDQITRYVNKNSRMEKDTSLCAAGTSVRNYIKNIDDEYIKKISIFNGDLILSSDDDLELEIGKNLGYIAMGSDDYKFMSLLGKMEDLVKEHEADLYGIDLSIPGIAPIDIAGLSFGNTWYRIDEEHLNLLGFSSEEVEYLKNYAPYVVRYTSGEVLSKIGKIMYAGTEREMHKYTFNYLGEDNNIVVADLLAGVNSTSEKNENKFGAFTSVNGIFTYDLDGGVVFGDDLNPSIGVLPMDHNGVINDEYTICVTVKCDTNQSGQEIGIETDMPDGINYHSKTILAVSDNSTEYLCWMGIEQNHLRIYSYRKNIDTVSWAEQPVGFMSVDVSEYNNKYMNIQFVAKRGEEAKLYINGNLKATESAGKEVFSYNTLTIGDLRKDRELRFEGKIYNVLIYGRALTLKEIDKNYNAIKNEIGF